MSGSKSILDASGKIASKKTYLVNAAFEFDGVKYPLRHLDEEAATRGGDYLLLIHALSVQNSDFNNLMLLMMKCIASDQAKGTTKFKELVEKLNLSVLDVDGKSLSILKDLM